MVLTIVSWFVLGWLVGIAMLAIISIVFIECENKGRNNEDFVIKLIEKKGWTEARWELETSFRGKYMRIWRKLYKNHIEENEKEKEND